MSYVNKNILRGILDTTLSFFNTTLTFTTAVLIIDTLTQYGAYIRSYRIVNNDAGNAVSYRTVSPTDPIKTVPPSSALTEQGWESFLEITPNAVTGSGYVELELVSRKDAIRPEFQQMQNNDTRGQVSA